MVPLPGLVDIIVFDFFTGNLFAELHRLQYGTTVGPGEDYYARLREDEAYDSGGEKERQLKLKK